jgi:hypothetical protein
MSYRAIRQIAQKSELLDHFSMDYDLLIKKANVPPGNKTSKYAILPSGAL